MPPFQEPDRTGPAPGAASLGAPIHDLPGGSADPRELPFDQYQRYRLVADVLEHLRGGGEAGPVLDVGGRTGVLRSFLPDRQVSLVDFEPSAAAGLVLGDGAHLPFRGGAFEVVTACDTLEHVPAERRQAFVRECCRVARRTVILVGPYRAPRVEEAEAVLSAFAGEKLTLHHRYLEEHRQLGLPERAEVEAWMRAEGLAVESIGHGNLPRWLALISLSLYMDRDPQLRRVARRYYSYFNEALYAGDRRPPYYRHVVVGRTRPDAPPITASLFPEAELPPATEGAFGQLLGELCAFDRERDVYEAERERLTSVNEGLLRDLEGHRDTLAEVRSESLARGELVAELERELARERAAGVQVTGELQRQLGEHRIQAEELRLDLGQHRTQAEVLHRELGERRTREEELRAELGEQAHLVASLRAELARSEKHERGLERRVERAIARADDLSDEIGARERENDELRADLRSRLRSLRRAFAVRSPYAGGGPPAPPSSAA